MAKIKSKTSKSSSSKTHSTLIVGVVEESVTSEEILHMLESDPKMMADMRMIKIFNVIVKKEKR